MGWGSVTADAARYQSGDGPGEPRVVADWHWVDPTTMQVRYEDGTCVEYRGVNLESHRLSPDLELQADRLGEFDPEVVARTLCDLMDDAAKRIRLKGQRG
jgi:hypothetical protein